MPTNHLTTPRRHWFATAALYFAVVGVALVLGGWMMRAWVDEIARAAIR